LLARQVALVDEHLLGVPVLGLAREVAAAFEQQDPLSRRREAVSQRAAAGARPDDDHVVVLAHAVSPVQTRAMGEVQAPVAPRSLAWVRTSAKARTPSAARAAVSRFSTTKTPW